MNIHSVQDGLLNWSGLSVNGQFRDSKSIESWQLIRRLFTSTRDKLQPISDHISPLDKAIASRAVIVIESGASGRAEWNQNANIFPQKNSDRTLEFTQDNNFKAVCLLGSSGDTISKAVSCCWFVLIGRSERPHFRRILERRCFWVWPAQLQQLASL